MKSHLQLEITILSLWVVLSISVRAFADDDPPVTFPSPNGEYTIAVLNPTYFPNQLLWITRGTKVIARYHFEGHIGVRYWSPSGRYVAFDNHFGHYAFVVWIINLRDGSVVTAHGPTSASDYDRYIDYSGVPDIMASKDVTKALHGVYPNYASDRNRDGVLTLAYGWKKGDILEMFHRLVFMDLLNNKSAVVEVLTQDKVDPSGIHSFGIPQAKLINFKSEPAGEPPEVSLVWP